MPLHWFHSPIAIGIGANSTGIVRIKIDFQNLNTPVFKFMVRLTFGVLMLYFSKDNKKNKCCASDTCDRCGPERPLTFLRVGAFWVP